MHNRTGARRGRSHHDVAREFHASPSTVHHRARHARGRRPDRVDRPDRSRVPHATRRTEAAIEDPVPEVRRQLPSTSDLGSHGAALIRRAPEARGIASLPAVRTVDRILRRRGALDGRRRVRRPPPPPGWYLPQVAARRHELDSVDVVEGPVIEGGPRVEVLDAVSRHGGSVASWPVQAGVTAKLAVGCLVGHRRESGLPGYARFDDDTISRGTHAHPGALGRVTRLCLGPGAVPVFVPPREPGSRAAIESSNGTRQAKVRARFVHDDPSGLRGRPRRRVAAPRRHRADRIGSAPTRRASPGRWGPNLRARPGGRMASPRRTDAAGAVGVSGRSFEADRRWVHRPVRAGVDLDGGMIRSDRLRRREPGDRPVIGEAAHRVEHERSCERGGIAGAPPDSCGAEDVSVRSVPDVVALAGASSFGRSGCGGTCACETEPGPAKPRKPVFARTGRLSLGPGGAAEPAGKAATGLPGPVAAGVAGRAAGETAHGPRGPAGGLVTNP